MQEKRPQKIPRPTALHQMLLLMALLACYKANNYGRGKCTMEEEALTACAQNQADLERTKDTSRYHLMRLVRQMRRL